MLSSGILKKIYQEDDVLSSQMKPVLQVLWVKKIPTSAERYRAMVSDGCYMTGSAIFTGEPCAHCAAKLIDTHTVIQINKFVVRPLQGKRVLVILSADVVTPASEVEGKIGDPQPFLESEMSQPKGCPEPKPTYQPQAVEVPPAKVPKLTKSTLNTSGSSSIFPIKCLTPYQNKWTIRARVSNKSAIKTWQNSRGEGKLFSVELVDENGEIRATGFNDCVDRFYELLQEGNVYLISKGSLKLANKAFTSVKNEYEMTFNNDTIIERCFDETNIPSIQYNFINIGNIETLPSQSVIDVLAVVKSCGQVQSITRKASNQQINKRELTIVDTTQKSISLTLWGDYADSELYTETDVIIALKGVRVGDFNGKVLSTIASTHIELSPDIKEAHSLMGWYESYGKNSNFVPLTTSDGKESTSVNKMLYQISSERLGSGEKADYLNVRAMLTSVKSENSLYKACPTPNCNKKLIDVDSYYRCEKCNQEFNNYEYRLILNCELSDASGKQFVTAFQDVGEKILGNTADQLGRLKDNGDEESYENAFKASLFKIMNFKLRVNVESYNDEMRTRCVCLDAKPVDYVSESKILIQKLKSL